MLSNLLRGCGGLRTGRAAATDWDGEGWAPLDLMEEVEGPPRPDEGSHDEQ